MRAIVVSTAPGRTTLAALVTRVNAREGYPKDGVARGDGTHATTAQGRTAGYALRTHPSRAGERAIVVEKPALRAAWRWVRERIAERIAAGTATAEDLAIDALVDEELPSDWQRPDTAIPARARLQARADAEEVRR